MCHEQITEDESKRNQINNPRLKEEKKNGMQVSPPGIHVSVVFSDGLKTDTKMQSKFHHGGRPVG